MSSGNLGGGFPNERHPRLSGCRQHRDCDHRQPCDQPSPCEDDTNGITRRVLISEGLASYHLSQPRDQFESGLLVIISRDSEHPRLTDQLLTVSPRPLGLDSKSGYNKKKRVQCGNNKFLHTKRQSTRLCVTSETSLSSTSPDR